MFLDYSEYFFFVLFFFVVVVVCFVFSRVSLVFSTLALVKKDVIQMTLGHTRF